MSNGAKLGSTTSKVLFCKNLQDYLKSLPKETLTQLYNHPATCLAILRELPELSRTFVLRLLFITKPVPQILIASWIPQSDHGRENVETALLHKDATQSILDMNILFEKQDERGNPAFLLNPTFQHSLKIATLGKGDPWTMSGSLDPDPHMKDIEFLDKYAMDRWESVLQFLVKPESEGPKVISRDAVRTLLHAGLIESAGGEKMQITSEGFQFLLMDTASQVWFFILKYLDTVTERGLSLDACLTFLFKLSFSTLGKDYSMEGMNVDLLTFLQHLREFGLVYLRKRSSGRFYPTRLALNITAGKNKGTIDVNKDGNLVIETNYRVYAYTKSELQIALLSIFTDIECRFPNLVVACVSRTSVRRALMKGIGAEQIISYLFQHCHPQMYKQNPVIPRTVADQIKLWELERERLEFTEGVLYKDFMSVHDFSLLCNYAEGKGVLIFSDEKSRTMIVTKKGHPAIKSFWKDAQAK
ncbi:UNVERIFIED_CONTAM: hypothetical protein GTU68_017594 [Idotea baltica]|nr:hypothetical protein [Idotea baltica]